MAEHPPDQLVSTLVDLDEPGCLGLVSEALKTGRAPMDVLDAMREGMTEIGARFADGTYFLTDLIMAGEIFRKAMEEVEPLLAGGSAESAGQVVFATVQGDFHDIGKNIVIAMLRGAGGYEVHDLGMDVAPERVVEELERTGAPMLGLCALVTTSFDSMRRTVDAVAAAGLRERVKIMVGGGPITDAVRAFVGADAFGRDAQQAVELARQFSRQTAGGL
jgi:methanogenic corrinoid protein MtbC1